MMSSSDTKQGEIRVLIADGAEILRRGVRAVLDREPEFRVVGEVAEAQDLSRAADELAPDVIFLGLGHDDEFLNRSDGLAALRETVDQQPSSLVVVLVEGDTPDDLLEPVNAGAAGVLLRDAPAEALRNSAHDVMAGGAALDPRLTRRLFSYLASGSAAPAVQAQFNLDPNALSSLSPRERQVLQLLCRGNRNKEIAAQLGVTVGTVKTHLRHIFRKLKVYDRTGAILTALRVPLSEAA